MSMILEALRRADAQREGDRRRGIHAQPLALPGDDEDDRGFFLRVRQAYPWLPWASGLAVLLAASLGWYGGRSPPAVAIEARVEEPPGPAQAPPPRPAPGLPPADAIVPAPVAAVAGPPAARPLVPAEIASPARSRALPADMPPLAISGGVHANTPDRRMLIVNGQVHGEGAEPAPGVRIEQIRPNAAVLRYRGQLYEVSF